jgi:hypothetical protein
MAEPRLEFLKNEAGEREGLGDAGIETFKDAPYASCAREAGQNSRDAFHILPVRLTFNLLHVPQRKFPDHARLRSAVEACAAAAENEKEGEFFANALALLDRPFLPVLNVSDYNTTGLTGPPHEPGTPFHSLVKSTGVSTKESRTAGGSFGIGKNASFAVSDLQMVFYATRYRDSESGKDVFAAQGKVKLVSHTDAHRVPRRFTGYWGDPNGYKAVLDAANVPDWMRRDSRGTSIFCAGFRESPDWAEHMTASLISHFFCAVHREEMVFDVSDGRFRINKNTLEHLLTADNVQAAAEKSGHLLDLEFAGQLYRCLVSPNTEEHIISVKGLGDMRVRILAEPGMPRRLGFIRNGMLITDNLRHFGHPMLRFPGSRDFVMLVEPADNEAGALLKRLENPSHDGFSAQRISHPGKRASAEASIKKLGRELREIIRKSAGVDHSDTVVLDELGRFFADPGRSEALPDPTTEDDPETHIFDPPRVRPKRRTAPARTDGSEGGRLGTGHGGDGEGGGAGPGTGGGSGGRGNRGRTEAIELHDVRNVLRRDEAGAARHRVLYFTPAEGGPLRLTIQATGINASETLHIAAVDIGDMIQGGIAITATAGERLTMVVTFSEAYDGPVEIAALNIESPTNTS